MLRKKDKKHKEKKILVIRGGTNKKFVIALWIILIVSITEYLEVEEYLGSIGELFKDKFKDLEV
ncbi:hypothetical protein [Clostridioides difficile]|uniref:hypothetical protein n=1 Tax=Clostridioides difficile TaxID=1496 RepID=UPI0031B60808